ncbi:abortive infection family protein [Mesorhizobium sp. CA16]|uniref:abortive infection family protein n=1 Tax=Mesorhizobium sp. CA16 TaxID=588496 RepID=UPI001CCE8D76|nr:abortive infection family protein [Mesorhizobium sp. CA16]MBZ9915824.1 abortive infection family protein [Mesorhizobium sp. CA16]
MPYSLQMLRALLDAHPDRAEPLRIHIEALERSIESQPAFCLQSVRTLFEAAHSTIAPRLGIEFARNDGFPGRMRGVIDAMDFSLSNHPNAAEINEHIKSLTKGIDDVAVALAKLSNVPNMRHGGSLDWGTLQRQHALMLGGLCDSLVAFLFDVAWSRVLSEPEQEDIETYDAHADFNEYLDNEYEMVEIAGARFRPSYVLFHLDETVYDAARIDWEAERANERQPNTEIAA